MKFGYLGSLIFQGYITKDYNWMLISLGRMRFIKSLILFIFFYSLNSFSQDTIIQFSSLTVNDGLTQSWIHCIHQDKLGTMWFGSEDGLNRYDGTNIIQYKYNSRDKKTLLNNTIHSIADGINNNVWVGTFNGICLYDREKDYFITLPHWPDKQVLSMAVNAKNMLWIVTPDTLFLMDQKDYRIIKKFPSLDLYQTEKAIKKTDFLSIFIDSRNNIWLGTNNGLCHFNENTEVLETYFYEPENAQSFGGENVVTMFEDHLGRLWIGHNNGLDLIESTDVPLSQIKFKHFINNTSNSSSISSGTVLTLIEDKNHILWVGVQNGGVNMLDINHKEIRGKFKHCNASNSKLANIRFKSIYSSYKDKQQNIWIGTYDNGVSLCSPIANSFNPIRHNPEVTNSLINNKVNAFFEDNLYIWIGTEGGLSRFDKKNGEFYSYTHDPHNNTSLSANPVWAIEKDKNGNIWIGTWAGGLNKLDVISGKFTHYLNNVHDSSSLGSNNIFAIYEDKEGKLWIGTMGSGLNRFDPETKKFKRYTLRKNGNAIIYVEDICPDNKGNLWLACMNKLACFNIQTEDFTYYIHNSNDSSSISGSKLYCVYIDSKNNLWIGTDVGLNLFNPDTKTFRSYQINDGLPDNAIKSITEDNFGNLWLGTNKGLSKFFNAINIPDSAVFKNYSAGDGIQSNEFNRRACLKGHDGKLYFGGENGFNVFEPDKIFENKYIPDIIFTDFLLFNNPVAIGETDSPLSKNISETKSITLTHKQSVFTIKFVALNYVVPQKNQYAYMMEGFDKGWNYVGSKREATYTNLEPGEYTFRVIASNNDGVWNKIGITLKITILPPWWKTIWFKLLLFLFILGLVGFFLYYRTRRLQMQKIILEKEVKLRTSQLSDITVILEEKQEEIMSQNEELEIHKAKLEQMVQERTADLEKALSKAEEADRLKTAFLANMSHEIRTPMNSIVGFTGLLGSKDYSESEKDEFISIIYGNCETLQVLIDDIIEISLIESNQVVIHKSDFDIIPIFKELESFYRIKNEKRLEISFNQKDNRTSLWINSDPIRFRQIITNLIDNAVKYTEKGFVEFGYQVSENSIEFYVKDSGIGIPEKEINNVFNHFYKVESNNNKLFRGTGIGLSICHKLVKLLEGTIRIESKLDNGTSVYFTLPYTENLIIETERTEVQKDTTFDFSALNLLIVEDEEFNFYLLKKIIEKTGSTITWAKNGLEAVEMIKNNFIPDMILMDIKMPVMNGVEATKIIRSILKDVPIIAVTAYTSVADKEKYKDAGFDNYITKPIDPNRFVKLLEDCLR